MRAAHTEARRHGEEVRDMRLKDVVELVNEKTDRVDRPYVALENIVSWDAKFVVTDAITEGTKR